MSIDLRPHRGRPDLFMSAKTPLAIPAQHPALRQALVRASLNPAVHQIKHIQTALVATSSVELDVVVVEHDGEFFYLDVVPARRRRSVEHENSFHVAMNQLGLRSMVVTAEHLNTQPMRANCDLVWSHRGRAVPVDVRLTIMQQLADDGPMALDRLLRGICGRDPAAAVMALCCDNLLELDLESGPLGPSTVVRTRT